MLKERSKMEDCDKDEKQSIEEFVGKIKPHFFKAFSQNLEVAPDEGIEKSAQET